MNKEELIRYGKDYLCDLTMSCCEISDIHKEFVREVIKALQQEPSEDCVSRQAVLKEIPRLWNSKGDKDYCMETLRDFVTELPPVTPTQKWIPISEKPPKDKQPCFVTKIIPGGYKRIVNTATYSTNLYEVNKYEFADKKNIPGFYNYGSDGYFECTGVIAWMPKPEPYKAKIDSEFKKNCNKCMHYTDADEIQGITPCGSCGVEKKNFEQKTEIDDEE